MLAKSSGAARMLKRERATRGRAMRRALLALLLVIAVHPAEAQFGILRASSGRSAAPASTGADTVRANNVSVSPESPRASMLAFLQLVKQHRYDQASQYLALSANNSERGEELSRRLRDVLDQRLWIDMEGLSPLAVGDTTDGEPTRDRLGVIPGASGLPEPVMLQRYEADQIARWVFDSATVQNVDGWYASLPDAWMRGHLPAPLLAEGPFGVYYWQWIGMLLAVVLTILFAAIISVFAKRVLSAMTARTSTEWDDMFVGRLRGPFRLWLVGVLAGPLFAVLGLNARVSGFNSAVSGGVVLGAIFWATLRLITLAQDQLLRGTWADGHSQARTLVPLLGRFLRVVMVVVAVLVVLSQFGYPVNTLLAGVGIGGIALALAAQKTVEHLFGSVSLAADKVFRVGDFVRIGEVEGTVERIGLRSTSVRTMARTIVRIPNGRLAEERIETFGARDRFLFQHVLGVTYETTPAQLRQIVSEIEATLRAHPAIWPEQVIVKATGFADSAITIRVRAWFEVQDIMAFFAVQHEMLLAFMDIVRGAGSGFAFPSRTVYHVNANAGQSPEHTERTVPPSIAPPEDGKS